MQQDLILTIIFAVIAAVVLFQLYNVLGKKVGRQPEDDVRAQPKAVLAVPDAAQKAPVIDNGLTFQDALARSGIHEDGTKERP